jgi:hypothetical protein
MLHVPDDPDGWNLLPAGAAFHDRSRKRYVILRKPPTATPGPPGPLGPLGPLEN